MAESLMQAALPYIRSRNHSFPLNPLVGSTLRKAYFYFHHPKTSRKLPNRDISCINYADLKAEFSLIFKSANYRIWDTSKKVCVVTEGTMYLSYCKRNPGLP